MKKFTLLAVLCLVSINLARADEITFTCIAEGNGHNVVASASGFTAGPCLNVLVSDAAKGLRFPLIAQFNTSAGAATSFTITSTDVNGTFGAGSTNSVSIIGSSTFLQGDMLAGGDLGATYPGGTGSFQSIFHVTTVDPAVLADFGLPPTFDPRGSVSITFGQNEVVGSQLEGVIGGGSATIVVSTTPVPEPARVGLVGMGMLGLMAIYRRWQLSQ